MQKIVIARQDNDIGFSLVHSGIIASSDKEYEVTFGNVPVLRETLLRLLDRLENDRTHLERIANDPTLRNQAVAALKLAEMSTS